MKNIVLYKKVVSLFGFSNQREMMIEECSELIQAIQNYKQDLGELRVIKPNLQQRKSIDNYVEELVDVEIVLSQLKCTIDEKIYNNLFYKIPYNIKLVWSYFEKGKREEMICECVKLIQAIQKVKREEKNYNSPSVNLGKDPNYFLYNKDKETKKIIETYFQCLVNIEIILIQLKKSVDKKQFTKHYNFKINRLKKRLNKKENENNENKVLKFKYIAPKVRYKAKSADPLLVPIKKYNY